MTFLLEGAVSPDGHWLAFYTGSITPPYDLTLKLFNIADQTTLTITRLLSPEYPSNLLTIAESLAQNDVDYPDPQDWLFSVEGALESSIHNRSWSPDGRFLAFTGQMHGPSTDLYLYEIETQTIHKVTEEPQFISSAQWSPNGQWITVGTTMPGVLYTTYRIHILRSRDRQVRWLRRIYPHTGWPESIWLSKDFLFMLGHGDGGDPYGLNFLDTQKDLVVEAWPGTVYAFAADIENRTIALSGVPYWLPLQTDDEAGSFEPQAGFYFVSIDDVEDIHRISDDVFWSLYFWGNNKYRFIGHDGKNVVGIAQDGSISHLYRSKKDYAQVQISPDRRWLVILGQGEKFSLFSDSGELVQTLELKSDRIIWRPDSAGLFISSDKLYFLSLLPDGTLGNLIQIKNCNKTCISLKNAAWLP